MNIACADPEAGGGVRTPTGKSQIYIGFVSNTGPGPLKNHKANIIGTPANYTAFRWRADDGLLIVVL